VESPIPSYVRAAKATAYPRNLDAQKPYTSAEMLEQAAALREERAKRLRAAQLRIEEARAVSMEKARKAALGAVERKQAPVQTNLEDERRAVNE
jgi:predicted Holliday junction resolvase-like endonuclease